MSENGKPQFLFVFGLAKSGTTFLRNLLHGDSRIHMRVEAWNRLYDSWDRTQENAVAGLRERYLKILTPHPEIRRQCFFIGDKILYGGKTPFTFLNLFEEQKKKILVISRDPRDRLVSERYHYCNRNHHPVPALFYPNWRPMKEVSWWGHMLPRLRSIGAHEVVYEELYRDPVRVLAGIFQYLELPASTKDLRWLVSRARNSAHLMYGENPLRQGWPGEWKKKLLPEECFLIREQLGDVLEQYGWERSPGWEYSALEALRFWYWRSGAWRKFPRRSAAFWNYVMQEKENRSELKTWWSGLHSYQDPAMHPENYRYRRKAARYGLPARLERMLLNGMMFSERILGRSS